MSRMRLPFLLAAVLVAGLARSAAAQGTACTTPNDPACNHLKCYQISDKPSTVVSKTPIVQLDNQFGREVLFRLQPVLLCVPSQKACCNATGCSVANCRPNPVPAPGLPHFKCYKIKAKTCPNGDCATLANFAKGKIAVNLLDQFGQELNVAVGKPVILCAPVLKTVVGASTTTTQTTTTITQTTTTTMPCRDVAQPGTPPMCAGDCHPGSGLQCVFIPSAGTCNCEIPCALQGTTCNNQFCPNATQQCVSNAVIPCGCCNLPGASCTAGSDCCSGTCNTPPGTCM
jgi:hypothetical protein